MKDNPGGAQETVGGSRVSPLEFYKNLGDKSMHSIPKIKEILEPIEECADFERRTAPDIELNDFLELEENQHWNMIEYRYEHNPYDSEIVSDPEGHINIKSSIYFSYSPWLSENKNVIMEGRIILDRKIPESKKSHFKWKLINNGPHIESTFVDEELCWISFPHDTRDFSDFKENLRKTLLVLPTHERYWPCTPE